MCAVSHYAKKAASFLFIIVYIYICTHQSHKICALNLILYHLFSLATLEMILHSEFRCPLAASISTFWHAHWDTQTHTHHYSFVVLCLLARGHCGGDDCFCQSCCWERPGEMACPCRERHWRGKNPNTTRTHTHTLLLHSL